MFRLILAASVLCFALTGCGTNVDDPARVPAGAADTSDPSSVNMGTAAPGAPAGAQAGPSGEAATQQ